MRLLCFAIFILLLGFETGCTKFAVSEPDPPAIRVADMDANAASDFQFVLGEGSSRMGFDVCTVDADGACTYTYQTYLPGSNHDWKRASFDIPPETVRALRSQISSNRLVFMDRVYRNVTLTDGSQSFIKMYISGKWKLIYCDNVIPAKIEQVIALVHAQIIDPNRQAISGAKNIPSSAVPFQDPLAEAGK